MSTTRAPIGASALRATVRALWPGACSATASGASGARAAGAAPRSAGAPAAPEASGGAPPGADTPFGAPVPRRVAPAELMHPTVRGDRHAGVTAGGDGRHVAR